MSKLIYNDLVSVEYSNEAGETMKCRYIGRIGYSMHFGLNEKYEVIVFIQNATNELDGLRRISQNSIFEKLTKTFVKDETDYQWSSAYLIGRFTYNGQSKYLGWVNGGCSGLALYDKVK